MADYCKSAKINASIALYGYMCQNIVGPEEHVKTIRMMNTVRDHLKTEKNHTVITSGSFGEGLNMRGSDLDVMHVIKIIEVYENTPINLHPCVKVCFTMETEGTKPGFTWLRLVHSCDNSILADCEQIGSDYYFSNSLFRQLFVTRFLSIVHGPCISDKLGIYDLAFCLRSRCWITTAKDWLTRSSNSWPGYKVKQSIVKHGVLFVPVGMKGSITEDLEWRISFSVAERLLIYSFTHTQLICYALLKILLKDVIDLDLDCKELLCSYFLKTVMFWISEELSTSIWTPKNLIPCFMRCFRRLIYCVEYSVCPHFFIPEYNLFENKIKGKTRDRILDKLCILNSFGWHCIFFSDQICIFQALAFDITKDLSPSHVYSINQLSKSIMNTADDSFYLTFLNLILEKGIHKVLSVKNSKIKYVYMYYMSTFCSQNFQLLQFRYTSGNRTFYKQYKPVMSILLMNTRHDAISGWLLLASFFYRTKQYNTALDILQYSLLKCTPDKLIRFMNLSNTHYKLMNFDIFKKMNIVQLRIIWFLETMMFATKSTLIPVELQINEETIDRTIPPVVYAHFLCFMCHYRLENFTKCRNSLRDLRWTIDENYLIEGFIGEALSYTTLGVSYELLKDFESAKQAFMQSIKLFPDRRENSAFKRLSLLT